MFLFWPIRNTTDLSRSIKNKCFYPDLLETEICFHLNLLDNDKSTTTIVITTITITKITTATSHQQCRCCPHCYWLVADVNVIVLSLTPPFWLQGQQQQQHYILDSREKFCSLSCSSCCWSWLNRSLASLKKQIILYRVVSNKNWGDLLTVYLSLFDFLTN